MPPKQFPWTLSKGKLDIGSRGRHTRRLMGEPRRMRMVSETTSQDVVLFTLIILPR